MHKIIGILLVGLLGFLGCSDSDDDTSTIGEATPVAPFGIIETPTPTYEWTPVPGATRYLLLVEDIDEAPVIEEWYTAEEGEYASEEGLCSVTPDVNVTGNTWKVLACAGEECGLWSDGLQFSFIFGGPTTPRFTDNGDDTVTDNNTKLIWSKNANPGGWNAWEYAIRYCEGSSSLAGYTDWRIPSLSELKSLIDKSQFNPALPPGNPFTNVQSGFYCWSSTIFLPLKPYYAWHVNFYKGYVWYSHKRSTYYMWCVRGGRT